MTFSDLWQKCRNGDSKACDTIHFYHYILPQMEKLFKRFKLEPPIIIPRPTSQPDPVSLDRIAGEAELFAELSRHKKIAKLIVPHGTQLETLKSLKSHISEWLGEIENDIKKLEETRDSKSYGTSKV